jgi:single-strand DNA-binding protein
MNEIIMSGRAVEDFTLKYSQKGNAFGKVRISDPEGQTTLYIPVIVFGRAAEKLIDVKKGDLLFIRGKLRMNTYEKDGEKKNSYQVVADVIKTVDELSTLDFKTQVKRMENVELEEITPF